MGSILPAFNPATRICNKQASMKPTKTTDNPNNASQRNGVCTNNATDHPRVVNGHGPSRSSVLVLDITKGVVNVSSDNSKAMSNLDHRAKSNDEKKTNGSKKTKKHGKNNKKSSRRTGNIGGESVGSCGTTTDSCVPYSSEKILPKGNGCHGWNPGGFVLPDQPANESDPSVMMNHRKIHPGDFCRRINSSQGGILGVVYVNEYGEPIFEYLPQHGYSYSVQFKKKQIDGGNRKKKQPHLQESPQDNGATQITHHSNYAPQELPGYSIMESTVGPTVGPLRFSNNGNTGASWYPPYHMYGPTPPPDYSYPDHHSPVLMQSHPPVMLYEGPLMYGEALYPRYYLGFPQEQYYYPAPGVGDDNHCQTAMTRGGEIALLSTTCTSR